MNPTKKHISPEDIRFDRLVDGELSETERGSLLASLDAQPEGWRRCALAFLEAQTWRESFGEFSSKEGKVSILPPTDSTSPGPKKKPLGAMGTVMAMAASFLLVFGLGGWILRFPRGGESTGPSVNMIADGGVSHIASPLPTVSANSNGNLASPKTSANTPWQMVQLQGPGLTADNQPLRLPALPRERLDDDFFKIVPSPIPDDVRQAFERTGHAVRVNRQLVPVRLDDGRQLIIPIDQVDVQYNNRQAN